MTPFAIVIPNLNQSHFLPTALDSLTHQNVSFNLAVMDGGSKDNYNDVIKAYSKFITFARSSKDNGQSAAIIEGKLRIQGDIISWLNADDYLFPNALEKVFKIFSQRPDVDVVYGDAIHVNAEGLFQCYFPPIQSFSEKELVKNCFICQPACFYRRTAYDAVGGLDPTLQYTMDWDLWCRLARNQSNFYYLKEPIAAVRYYSGTKTLSGNKKRFKEIYRIEKKYGSRLLRTSFIGAYFYGLTIKENKSNIDRCLISIFQIISHIKASCFRWINHAPIAPSLLYGFHRWEKKVKGGCTIHLPWYHFRKLKEIILTVGPDALDLRITINGISCSTKYDEKGQLHINVPQINEPHHLIQIESNPMTTWELLTFDAVY